MFTRERSAFCATLIALGPSIGHGQARAQGEALPVASPITIAASFTPVQYVAATTPIVLTLSRTLDRTDGVVVVMIGAADVTALFERRGAELAYRARSMPLPAGEHDVVVYLVNHDEWKELARACDRSPHAARLHENPAVAPTAAMNNKGQLAQRTTTAAAPTDRPTFQDLQLSTGLHSTQERGAWVFDGQANAVGVTNRREALRFAQDSTDAPRFDLAGYTLSLKRGASSLALGDVTVGANRYLANGFAARGIAASIGGRALSVALGALGGSPEVGWDHPIGFTRPEHRVATATINAELRPDQPGTLHLDATLVNGSLLPRSGFSRGALTDAERSTGAGLQLSAALPSQRVRMSAGIAESRFANPHDPLLADTLTIKPLAAVQRTARFVEGNAVLVRQMKVFALPALTLEVGVRREHVDPLYRSVAVGTQSDVLANGGSFTVTFGALNLQGTLSRANDNLAAVPSLMRTFTRTMNTQATLPIAALFGRANPGAAWPTLTYTVGRTGQLGTTVADSTPFTPNDLPDLVATTHDAGVQWQGAAWRASYRFNSSLQDNRQPVRSNADQLGTTHTINIGRTLSQHLDASVDASAERHNTRGCGAAHVARALGWNHQLASDRDHVAERERREHDLRGSTEDAARREHGRPGRALAGIAVRPRSIRAERAGIPSLYPSVTDCAVVHGSPRRGVGAAVERDVGAELRPHAQALLGAMICECSSRSWRFRVSSRRRSG